MTADMMSRARTRAILLLVPLLLLAARADRAGAQTPQTGPAVQTGAPTAQESTPPLPPGYINEPPIVDKAVDFAGDRLDPSGPPKDGFYPEFGNMITGSGWISIGPGYRYSFLDGHALVDGSAAISWRGYTIAQARAEVRPGGLAGLTVGSQVFWQDTKQNHFFGVGPESRKADTSEYRLRDVDVIGYARVQPRKWLAINGSVGWLRQPDIDSAAGPFKGGADTRVLFGDAGAPGILSPASFLHGDLAATVDTRDARGHPTRGGLYRVAWAGYSDRDSGQYSFHRYEVEGVQFIPLVPARWTLAVHGWLAASAAADGKTVPVYMMPSLGGSNTLRGFADYRFHDRDLLLLSGESRWAVMTHVDAAVFVDAGNVAAQVGDLSLRKTSVGVGARVHTRTATLARLDIAHSADGWRLMFKMDDPFALSRLLRRMAAVPMVP
jgi:hypothetical protein